jgi:hypothetical protein
MAKAEDIYPGCHQAPFGGLSNQPTALENRCPKSSLWLSTRRFREGSPSYANDYLFLFRFGERK